MAALQTPRFPTLARLAPAFAIGLATLLAGCGGSGDDASTSRQIDAAGGSISADSLSLSIPPAALATLTPISAEEVPAGAGELARYRFTPAGLQFAVPAALSIDPATRPTLAGLTAFPAGARLFWQVGGERWLIPGAAAGTALTADLPTLGYPAADRLPATAPAATGAKAQATATPTRRAAAEEPAALPTAEQGGDLVVAPLDCDSHVDSLAARISDPGSVGSFALAGGIRRDVQATLTACSQDLKIAAVQESSCVGLAAARNLLQTTQIDSFGTLTRLTLSLAFARAMADQAGANCENDDPIADNALLSTQTGSFLDALITRVDQDGFDDTTIRDVGVIAAYEANCQFAGLGDVCERFPTEVYGRYIRGLRLSAFNDCAADQTAIIGSQLFAALGFSDTGRRLLEYGGLTPADLERDLSYCRNPSLEIRVFDDLASELVDRRVTLNARNGEVGDYQRSVTVNVPPRGALEIGGSIPAPVCPNGTLADVDLVVRVNDTELARRDIRDTGFLLTPSISIPLSTVQAALGNADGNAPFTLKLNREGNGCVIQQAVDAVAPVPATTTSAAQPGKPAVPLILGFNEPFTLFEINGGTRRETRTSRISAGAGALLSSHSCAVTLAGGAARCWGNNVSGQLGNGQRSATLEDPANATPTDVVGLGSGIASISSGGVGLTLFGSRSCTVSSAGAAQCWGGNVPGALGIGSNDTLRITPVTVSGLGSGVAEVAVGGLHACARTAGGAVRCWGANYVGQLGIGSIDNSRTYEFDANPGGEPVLATMQTDFRATPVEVSGLGSGVVDLAAGYGTNCAVLDSGAVRCWGFDLRDPQVLAFQPIFGGNQIDTAAATQAAPVEVAGLGSTVSQVAVGGFHACALLADGGVRCWGNNAAGQLGNGSTTGSATPVMVTGLPAPAVAVATGTVGSCALLETGRVHCWGVVVGRSIDDPNTGSRVSGVPISGGPGETQPLAQEVPGFGDTVTDISVGDTHVCAYQQDGAVRCLGNNSSGALGDGSLIDRRLPIGVLRFP